MKRILPILLAAVLLSGCFKKVTTATTCVVRMLVQESSTEKVYTTPTDVETYAFYVDDTAWEIRSYADAVAHLITSTEDGELRNIANVTGEPYTYTPPTETVPDEGTTTTAVVATYQSLYFDHTPIMLVAVDKTNHMYAYMFRSLEAENLAYTYLTLVFQPWQTKVTKQGSKEGYIWQVFPPDYDAATATATSGQAK